MIFLFIAWIVFGLAEFLNYCTVFKNELGLVEHIIAFLMIVPFGPTTLIQRLIKKC